MITQVDVVNMELTGDEFTLVVFHEDKPGAIYTISQILSDSDINIVGMRVFRKAKHKDAVIVINTDSIVPPITVDYMCECAGIEDIITFEAI